MNKTFPNVDYIGTLKQEFFGNFPCNRTLKIVSSKDILISGEVFETIEYGSNRFVVYGGQALKVFLGVGQRATIVVKHRVKKTPLKLFHDSQSITAAKKILQFYTEEGQPVSFFNDYYDGYSIDGNRNVSAISVSITRE
jgi:hypothetical protein